MSGRPSARAKEEVMHPEFMQILAAQRTQDMLNRAAVARQVALVRKARRARRHHAHS